MEREKEREREREREREIKKLKCSRHKSEQNICNHRDRKTDKGIEKKIPD